MDFDDTEASATFDERELKVSRNIHFAPAEKQQQYYEDLNSKAWFSIENMALEPLGRLFLSLYIQGKKSMKSAKDIQIEDWLKDFKKGDEPPSSFTDKKFETFQKSKLFREYIAFKTLEDLDADFNDFEIVRTLGAGALGHVLLCYHMETGKLCVVKRMDKRAIKKMGATKNVCTEAKLLSVFKHTPFITRPLLNFHSKEDPTGIHTIKSGGKDGNENLKGGYFHIVMEACLGGSLKYQIEKNNGFDEDTAKYYAAEILIALNKMHSREIVYRDLKPENVLLRKDGHSVLADMGTAEKMKNGKMKKRRIGTPFYWAPEVAGKKEYNERCDIFTWGIVIWEMITGKNPYKTLAEEKNIDGAKVMKMQPAFSKAFSKELKKLLEKVLEIDQDERLTDIPTIMNHEWFEGIDWNDIKNYTAEPPVEPDEGSVNFLKEDDIPEMKDDGWPDLEPKDHEPYNLVDFKNKEFFQELYVEAIIEGLVKVDNKVLERRLSKTPLSAKRRSIVGSGKSMKKLLTASEGRDKQSLSVTDENKAKDPGSSEKAGGNEKKSSACMIL